MRLSARSRPAPAWRWAAVLGFALLAPATLPAGGGERRLPEVRRRQGASEPLLAGTAAGLRCAPDHRAPVLRRLEAEAPLRVLRRWWDPDGRLWLRVASGGPAGDPVRGWLSG